MSKAHEKETCDSPGLLPVPAGDPDQLHPDALRGALRRFSHAAINRYLRGERMTARWVWDNVREQVVATPAGYLVFDDTVLDKDGSRLSDLVQRQYSGNAHGLIRGIGVVNGLCVNPETDDFWLIDYRLYDPDGDGKPKLDHVHDMLTNVVHTSDCLSRRCSWIAGMPPKR